MKKPWTELRLPHEWCEKVCFHTLRNRLSILENDPRQNMDNDEIYRQWYHDLNTLENDMYVYMTEITDDVERVHQAVMEYVCEHEQKRRELNKQLD